MKSIREMKKYAFNIALELTKEAAKGGYNKDSLDTLLKNVYVTALELVKTVEQEEKKES